ncbi:MAG TPA: glutathione S-transferase family protein [Candidatus Udaeobacter sp.]|jgi:putative glutathione S-transferase|nr:glutathione S-transferase family protein [Candidatus Udaeobacter sp.]
MRAQFPDEETESGEFKRQKDAFREWISNDGSTPYAAESGRYHLYVSLACPWASRTVIVRKLKKLEEAIGMTVVDPIRDEQGWAFRDASGKIPAGASFESTDPINGFKFLNEAYKATDPGYAERVTVPVLWDIQNKRIVNNCEDDICRMFNDIFNQFAQRKELDLFPQEIESEHARLSDFIYENVNNGVYKAGFSIRQHPYELACRKIFEAFDELEQRLSKSRYLFGNRIVEADWRLFCTLVRFDAVYHGHFKCNLHRIIDYPNLQGYLMDLYQQPGVADTVNFDHIKRHYYMTHTEINPTRIVPIGPLLDFSRKHAREKLK